jgi:hypothetical protein
MIYQIVKYLSQVEREKAAGRRSCKTSYTSPNIERRWKNKQEADGTFYHSSLIVELRMIKLRVEVLYYKIQEKGESR